MAGDMSSWDADVPGEVAKAAGETVALVRVEMDAAVRRAREGAEKRIKGKFAGALGEQRRGIRAKLAESKGRARRLLGDTGTAAHTEDRTGKGEEPEAEGLPIPCLHTLERLLSHVRHSIVRVCFYNLKLFCPSLVDEYDAHVREQVRVNIDQLGLAREEITSFFVQPLSDGVTVGAHFPAPRERTLARLDNLIALAAQVRDSLDTESERVAFAAKAPGLIDGVMDALQEVQRDLDGRKLAVGDLVHESMDLHRSMAQGAGLEAAVEVKTAPKVFGERRGLLNVFGELIANAIKYSQGSKLQIRVQPASNKQVVEVAIEDNGQGMTAQELAACCERGVSKSGTGEGLPMVVDLVEAAHLGTFEIDAGEQAGCIVTVRLPVKFNPTPAAKK